MNSFCKCFPLFNRTSIKPKNLLQCAEIGDETTARKLIEKGADPNKVNDRINWNAFHTAVYYEQIDFIKFLFSVAEFRNKHRCVLAAVSNGNEELTRLLIEKVCDVNETNERGFTPLHIAVSLNSDVICRILLDAGANVNAETNNGLTPAHLAVPSKKNECLELLVQHGADLNILDRVPDRGQSPFMLAISIRNLQSLSILLKGNVDLKQRNATGKTVLHTIVSLKHDKRTVDIASLLLDYDVDINAQDANGNTALMVAAMRGFKDMSLLLIKRGADVTITNQFHETAFDLSCNASITSLIKHTMAENDEKRNVLREGMVFLANIKAAILLDDIEDDRRAETQHLIGCLEDWLRGGNQPDNGHRQMTFAQKEKLQKNRLLLVEEITPTLLFNHFIQYGVFDDDMVEEIRLQGTRRRMTERMLDMLSKRGRKAYDVMCEALTDVGQEYLVDVLTI